MATKQELIDSAYQIIRESEKGGNTASRVGNLFLALIGYTAGIDGKIVDIPEYDDSELRKAIDNLKDAAARLDQIVSDTKDLATSERDRLQALLDSLDQTINGKFNDMLNTSAYLENFAKQFQQNVAEGKVAFQSGWNEDLKAYLQQAGVWAWDGDFTKTQWTTFTQGVDQISSRVNEVTADLKGMPTKVQWSEISQKVDSIESSVNSLTVNGDVSEALQTAIKQYVKDGVAGMNLESMYALKDTENSKKILEWMYSAFKNESSKDMSFAEMVAAGKDGTSSGISEVRSVVDAVQTGDLRKYVAHANLTAMVDENIAELYNEASDNRATTKMFSQMKKTIDDVTVYNTAGVVTETNLESATASLFADSEKRIKTDMGVAIIDATSGLVSETTVNDKITKASNSLTAQIKEVDEKGNEKIVALSGIVTEVQKDLDGEVQARIDALAKVDDSISGMIAKADLEGAMTQLIAQKGDISAAVIAKVNEEGSKIQLSADKVTMTNAFATSLTTNSVFTNYLEGGSATFSGHIIARSLELSPGVSIAQDDVDGLETTVNKINEAINTTNKQFNNYYTISQVDGKYDSVVKYVDGKIDTLNVSEQVEDVLKGKSYITTADITITKEESEGYTIETIKVGTDKTFTSITEPNGQFLLTDVGKGKDEDGEDYFLVNTEGLLKARNAIIYGTIYATDGKFSGEITATKGSIGGLEISKGILQSASGSTGITGGSYTYYKDGNPMAFWAGNSYPTETWVQGKWLVSGVSDSLWVRGRISKQDGSVVYSKPQYIGSGSNFSTLNYYYGLSTSQTVAPSSWVKISSCTASPGSSDKKAGYYMWVKVVEVYNNTTTTFCLDIDSSEVSTLYMDYADGPDIWREGIINPASTSNYWVRFRVNQQSSLGTDITYTTPMLITVNTSLSYKYAIQKKGITTPPTSGWSSSCSSVGTITLADSYKTSGYRLWIEITAGEVYYTCVDADASINTSIAIQTIDSDSGGPSFTVTQNGSLHAVKGSIGGFTLSSSSLSAGSVGLNSTDNISIWAGSGTPSSAPFKVYKNGALYATSGVIGDLVINSYGGIKYTATNMFCTYCTFVDTPTSGTIYQMSQSQSYITVCYNSSITQVSLPQNGLGGSFVIVHNMKTTAITISTYGATSFVGESISFFSLGAGKCFVGFFLRPYGFANPFMGSICLRIKY